MVDIDQLLAWLHQHQLHEQDFFRSAIIEGLEVFRFRLLRLRWLGWGYTLDSLRQVMQAYLALNGVTPDWNARPDAGSALMKLGSIVRKICKLAHIGKETNDTTEFVIDAYGKAMEIAKDPSGVSGLLS